MRELFRCLHTLIFFILLFNTSFLFAVKVTELNIKGGIGPATADYLVRGIEKGKDSALILIKMDTPGGLDKSTRQIVQEFLSSPVPIVVYVTPSGARAASAGTFLLYASTIAAMTPGTHLGAASPVSLTGGMGGEKKDQQSTMSKKVMNDAVAYIRSLAQLRNRNVEFGEKAILDAATMTASEALKANVIDIIAKNTSSLLQQLNGVVVTQKGQTIKLNTSNVEIEKIQPDWRMRFLLMITDPTVAYLLLLLGIYGIFFELMNPGFIVPGVIGAVSMLIALYALQLLPINYAGLGLIILGIAFIIAEAYTPSFGMLGMGGTLAFIVGSIMLIDTEHEGYQIAWSAIWAMAAANVMLFLIVFSLVMRSRWRESMHGTHALINQQGQALEDINLQGQALIKGEIWTVKAQSPIKAGKAIKVIDAKGLILEVEEIR
ncbi:nodulation protein NfeD [Legionella israelensis]|uniref:Nodulation protein NfeD n=1 Tax=Legionella israelensis TaxID=454 RepID=A0A0W0V1M1_9GAMM|nr:nodulation protein NfeD [Legionella israelensis]KTD13999.1 transmembrane protein [Legionella israelensis]QBR82956.1 nodulation protein NfeD [Legionella israelensis]QBS09658.1 nodulation protein NfeD [Legionella israelensis]SCY25858.1 membrane-bound serine protease (ClpP class) [Legionella israelensis DSM 19235]STX60589.1 transmembrane protein [Legionella israelensis]